MPNVSFDFSYFTPRQEMLDFYPEEFRDKYILYTNDRRGKRWQELDSPTSFAIKCNRDTMDYAVPPFAGILREIFTLEDYKSLKLTKTALENYAMISMQLPMDEEGRWLIDFNKAKDFWRNLDTVLPEEVGSVLTPMKLEKIGFERSNTGDIDTVADSEEEIFSSAGVSSLIFSNNKASANALLLSIKADQSITFGIVKSIEDAVNRYIRSLSYGKNFTVTFLDVSAYNRKEMADQYLKAATYGLPTISAYAATVGLTQSELDSMSFLEGGVLNLHNMFRPLLSSAHSTAEDIENAGITESVGAPQKDMDELTEQGEQSREDM